MGERNRLLVRLLVVMLAAAPVMGQAVERAVGADTETIIVTASREAGSLAEAVVPIVYFDEEDINRRQAVFLEDILRGAAGVSISRSGGYGGDTAIRIRGGESNHTKLRIDGIEAGDVALATPVNLAFGTLTGVRQVSLLRGPQSGVWGSDALSGAILLSTTPDPDEAAVAVKLAGGGRDTVHIEGSGTHSTQKSWVQGSMSHYETAGINHLLVGDERDAYRARTTHATAGFWHERGGESGVVLRHLDIAYDYDGFGATAKADTDANYSTGEQTQFGGYTSGSFNDTGNWQYRARLTGLVSKHHFYQQSELANSYQGRRVKLEAQSTYATDRHRLTGALEFLRETYAQSFTSKAFGDPDYERSDDVVSLVSEYELQFEPARVMLSLRYDDNSNWRSSLTYRLAARWDLARGGTPTGTTLFAAYGTGVVNPTFLERYGFIPDSFQGNAALRPELATEISAEVRQLIGGDGEVWLGFFSATFKAEIHSTFIADTGLSSVANASGNSTRRGVELGFKARLNAALRLNGAFSWLDAKEPAGLDGARQREIRRPARSGRGWLSWQRERWQGQAGWTHVGARDDTDFTSFPATNVRLGAYNLAHINLEFRLTKDVALFAKLDNAFNEEYQEVFGFRSIGRQWLLGVSMGKSWRD